jgi:hypothetical protein
MNMNNLIMLFVSLLINAKVYASSVWSTVDDLRSRDTAAVERACQALGIECGLVGPLLVQVLGPCCPRIDLSIFAIAVSWQGPLNGYVILMDSKGRILDKRGVGYIRSLSLRPLQTEDNDCLIIEAITGTGTGMQVSQFYIFSLEKGKFDEVWNGLSYEKSFPLGVAKNQNYEIKGTLNFDDIDNDGVEEMIYTTKRIQYSFEPETRKLVKLKTETKIKVYKLMNGKYVFLKDITDPCK